MNSTTKQNSFPCVNKYSIQCAGPPVYSTPTWKGVPSQMTRAGSRHVTCRTSLPVSPKDFCRNPSRESTSCCVDQLTAMIVHKY